PWGLDISDDVVRSGTKTGLRFHNLNYDFGAEAWMLTEAALEHEEADPRKRRCIIQKMGNHARYKPASAQQIGDSPEHAENRGGDHDARSREKSVHGISKMRESEGN